MTDHDLTLARRAVACPGWRWVPGMLDTDGNRYQWRHENRQAEACTEDSEGAAYWTEPDGGSLPDLTDAPTRGAVLELVREAHQDPTVYAQYDGVYGPGHGWTVWTATEDQIGEGASEIEALIAALEAAPGADDDR